MITTGRIILRHFVKADLSDLHQYAKIDGLGEAAGWKHHETTAEGQQQLQHFLKNRHCYAIELKRMAKVMGHITVHDDSVEGKPDVKELGFVLHPVYQNQGIMTEVVLALLADLFSKDITCVYACCFQNNVSSRRLIKKCGFLFDQEGTFFSASLNQTFSSYEYLLTKKQWENSKIDKSR